MTNPQCKLLDMYKKHRSTFSKIFELLLVDILSAIVLPQPSILWNEQCDRNSTLSILVGLNTTMFQVFIMVMLLHLTVIREFE